MKLLAVTLVLCWALASARRTIPHYDINLDLEPSQRWKEVAARFGPTIDALAEQALEKRVPPHLLPFVRFLSLGALQYIEEPYRSELTGLAHYGNVSLPNLVALQFLYDATAFCTSIVCVDANNRVWHARNLDYGLDPVENKGLKDLTIDTSFVQKGKTVLRSVTFAGLLGFLTGVKMSDSRYSLTLNERNTGGIFENILAAIDMLVKTGKVEPVFLRLRHTMMTAGSYDEALSIIKTTHIIAPCYIIIGGMSGNQGAVVTRDRMKTVDVRTLNIAAGQWFLLETNYDWWTTPPPDDDRRDAGKRAMNAMGRENITSQHLFDVLFTPPVLNNSTVYSTVMSASNKSFQVQIP